MYDGETSNRPTTSAGFMMVNGWDWGAGGSILAQDFDDGVGRLYVKGKPCEGSWSGWSTVALTSDFASASVNYANYAGYLTAHTSSTGGTGADQLYLWYDWNNTGSLGTYFHGIWAGSPDGNIGYDLAYLHGDHSHLYMRSWDYGSWNNWYKICTNADTYVASDGTNRGIINGTEVASSRHLLINGVTWNSDWYWDGQGGQPTWLWGSNDGTNMYVWNPSNFSVNYASSAGNADTVDGYHYNNLPYLPVAQVSEAQNDSDNPNWGKTYAESHRQSLVYNTSGREWAYWIGMRSSDVAYGTILRLSHDGLVQYAHKAGGSAGQNWSAWKSIITSDNIGS